MEVVGGGDGDCGKSLEHASEEASKILLSLERSTGKILDGMSDFGIGASVETETDIGAEQESGWFRKVTLPSTQSINGLCWVSQSSLSTA